MNSTVLTWAVAGLGLLVIVTIILLYFYTRAPGELRALNSGWREVAARSRITYTPPTDTLDTARLHGTHRQREVAAAVRMRTAYGQGGQQIHYYTRLEAQVANPSRTFLRINAKGRYRKTDAYLGQPLRPLDDPPIDDRFDIKCIPPDVAEKLIEHSRSLRGDLLAMKKGRYFELELEGNAVDMELEGIETHPDTLISLFDLLCDLAEAHERHGH